MSTYRDEPWDEGRWDSLLKGHTGVLSPPRATTPALGLGDLATARQVAYLEGLRDGKDLSNMSTEAVDLVRGLDFSKMFKSSASMLIELLKPLPWMPNEVSGGSSGQLKQAEQNVKDGRYAVTKPDGTLMFYSVKKGHRLTFVDVWASDARWPVKSISERIRVLESIAADPDAGPRFGREIGSCYRCGRTLTDDISRSLGIGPDCRSMVGYA